MRSHYLKSTSETSKKQTLSLKDVFSLQLHVHLLSFDCLCIKSISQLSECKQHICQNFRIELNLTDLFIIFFIKSGVTQALCSSSLKLRFMRNCSCCITYISIANLQCPVYSHYFIVALLPPCTVLVLGMN